MIVRILPDNSVKIVNGINPEDEDSFLEINNDGKFLKVNELPESRFNHYKFNPETNQIEVDEEKEIESYKKELIDRANEIVQEYILEHYPLEKQNADAQQKNYYGTALLMVRLQNHENDNSLEILTVDKIYLNVGNFVMQILNNEQSLESIVSQFPENEQYYWEQLIKGGLRDAWTISCVNTFNQYKKRVQNCSSIEELEQLDVQVLEFPIFPL